jgi:hypothetical protein
MWKAALAGVLVLGTASLAMGAEANDPYLDDRSTAEAVVRSYYNAINLHEYARAYSYFGSGVAPAFDEWEAGYENTGRVDVTIGEVAQEGAAGSVYYTLPVALDVTPAGGGKHQSFSGCYQLRLVQPANQSPPFEGIHIEKGDLKAADPGVAPPKCD